MELSGISSFTMFDEKCKLWIQSQSTKSLVLNINPLHFDLYRIVNNQTFRSATFMYPPELAQKRLVQA